MSSIAPHGVKGTDLVRTLATLLPDGAAVAGGRIVDGNGQLFDVEEAAIVRAVDKRQAEFRAGRTYARAALRTMGQSGQPMPPTADRYPQWPDGFIGSISHSDTICAAIVAQRLDYWGLGLDIEPTTRLDSDLYHLIGRPEERSLLSEPVEYPSGTVDRGKLVFAAKEAVFKAYYPGAGYFLDFQDASISFGETGTFTAVLVENVPSAATGRTLHGRWVLADGHIATLVAIKMPREM